MAYDYAPIKATAATLLADFGQSVTIRAYTVTGTDPVAGTVTRTSADTTASCVKTRFNERNTPTTALIEQGDLLAILDKVVAVDDEIIIGSTLWQVIDVFPVEPGSTGVIWKAQIRGGGLYVDSELYYVVNGGVYVVNSGTQVVNTP